MKILFMGRKPAACQALELLVARGVEVAAVVAPPRNEPDFWHPRLADTADRLRLPLLDMPTVDRLKSGEQGNTPVSLTGLDLVISFLFWKRIKQPLIDLPRLGCINFHAAPTPPIRGVCGYSFGIYHNLNYWGATAHFIDDERFDTGDIIRRLTFPCDLSQETALSLEKKSRPVLLKLFQEVIELALSGKLPRTPQGDAECIYGSKVAFENLKLVREEDSSEEVDRKVRACWFPPYEGATICREGRRFTLVTPAILKELGNDLHSK